MRDTEELVAFEYTQFTPQMLSAVSIRGTNSTVINDVTGQPSSWTPHVSEQLWPYCKIYARLKSWVCWPCGIALMFLSARRSSPV